MTLNVLYFAWLRERIGLAVRGGRDRRRDRRRAGGELRGREERYALAFSDMASVRVAVDQELRDLAAPLAGAREVAFFPPMTGG